MVHLTQMPDRRAEKPGISQLFRRLLQEGAQLAEAELALARDHAQLVVRRYLLAGAIALFGLAVASVAIFIVAEGLAVAAIPYVSNPAFAYLGVGFAFLLIGVISLFVSIKFLSRQLPPVGLIAKWIAGRSGSE